MNSSHSFYTCPLRSSSSLLIVNQLSQTIIAATDEVFDRLGYQPNELMGHSILTLALQQQHHTSSHSYYAQHARQGQVAMDICVHHDPFGAADSLDYWLIKLGEAVPPATVLRLSPYGTIEHAHPSPAFYQHTSEMLGKPIMGYIHSEDLPMVCTHLGNAVKSKTYYSLTFRARWSKYAMNDLPDDSQGHHYDWMAFTTITTGHITSSTPETLPCRPICLLRPVPKDTLMEQARHLCFAQVQWLVQHCLRIGSLTKDSVGSVVVTGWHQSKTFSLTVLAHLLANFLDAMHPLQSTQCPQSLGHREESSHVLYVDMDPLDPLDPCPWQEDYSEHDYRRIATLQQLLRSAENTFMVQYTLSLLSMAGLLDRARCVTGLLGTSLEKQWIHCLKMHPHV
ncbi:hypothetical protein BDF14DRAFT_625055 [Spinellus fusiger]|nr:hypothetical protein BDF14DRAFT_625055 [Spinellus fusiger]